MAFDFQVHKPVKGGAEHEVTENAYAKISGEHGSFLLRGGQVWSEDGEVIDDKDVPDWVYDIIDAMKDKGASLGFKPVAPEPAPAPLAPKAPAPAPAPAKGPAK